MRSVFLVLQLGVDPHTRPALAGVGGVNLLLGRQEAPVTAGVRVDAASALGYPHREPAALWLVSVTTVMLAPLKASMIPCSRAAPTTVRARVSDQARTRMRQHPLNDLLPAVSQTRRR